MADSPQRLAYRHMQPQSAHDCSTLMNGGVWQARDPLLPFSGQYIENGPPINATYRVHLFKARPRGRFGRVWHEIYSVETGEVVGRIN